MPLLDSDVVIDIMRQHPAAIAWLASLGEQPIVLPGFVVMELYQGCQDKQEMAKVKRTLQAAEVVWPTKQTSQRALNVFADHTLGSGLGLLDALIGQMSVDLDMPLHTFNKKHYRVIPDLITVQPYQR